MRKNSLFGLLFFSKKKKEKQDKRIATAIANQEIPNRIQNRIKDVNPRFFEESFPVEIDTETFDKFITAMDKPTFTQALYKIYRDIQTARMDFDYTILRSLTTDELFNNYKGQLDILQLRNAQNIMVDFNINEIMISDIRAEDNLIAVDVNAIIDCYDYIIDTKTGWVTRGNKYAKVAYNYKLTFIGSNEEVVNLCPNCGAQLPEGNSTQCPYCNSIVVNKKHQWVLSREKVISRISRYKNHFLKENKAREVSLETFNQYAADYDKTELETLLYNLYKEITFSFLNEDLNRIEALSTPNIFTSYKQQLDFLKQTRGKNIIKDFHLFNAGITEIKSLDNNLSIEIFAVIGYYDYVINTSTNKVIIGNKEQRIIYNYRLRFIGYRNEVLQNCPNCGAKGTESVCSHCNTKKQNNNHKWILSGKKIINKIRDE